MKRSCLWFLAGAIVLMTLSGCSANTWRDIGHLLWDFRTGQLVEADHGVLLYGNDVLATPGAKVRLMARLRSPKSLHGIDGVTLSFYEDGRSIGHAITDDSGAAEIDYTAATAGQHVIRIHPTRLPWYVDEDYEDACRAKAELLVDAEPADAKFIVLDLDRTLVDEGWVNVLTKKDPKAMAESVMAMRRISQAYHVIYLTHRPNALTAKSKLWLRDEDLPRGVLLAGMGRKWTEPNEKYKAIVLAELRKSHPGIAIGVGDQASDAWAYVENGMTAYLIPQCKPTPEARRALAAAIRALPDKDRVQVVTDWAQVEQGILHGRRFPAEEFARKLEERK